MLKSYLEEICVSFRTNTISHPIVVCSVGRSYEYHNRFPNGTVWTLSTDKTDTPYSIMVYTLTRYRVLGCARDSCNSTLAVVSWCYSACGHVSKRVVYILCSCTDRATSKFPIVQFR